MGDADDGVQTQAAGFLRNMPCGYGADGADRILQGGGGCLVAAAERVLRLGAAGAVRQALYAVCNLAAATTAQAKRTLQRPSLLSALARFLRPAAPRALCHAAVWCVVNLVWPVCPAAGSIARSLLALGFRPLMLSVRACLSLFLTCGRCCAEGAGKVPGSWRGCVLIPVL